MQVGALRAGWYSDDLLDNLGRPSATTIVPDLQRLEIGQWVPMAPFGAPSDRNAFKVHSFEVHERLLWTKPYSTWAWRLTPTSHGTRLVTRVHAVYDWRHPLAALLAVVLMEFGDFAMQRGAAWDQDSGRDRWPGDPLVRPAPSPARVGHGAAEARRTLGGHRNRRRNPTRLASATKVVGLLAVTASVLYFVSDVIEALQGGFSVGQLWLTLITEAATPIFLVGLAIVQRPRLGRLGELAALAYAYSFIVFTGTVVYALVNGTKDYDTLTDELGAVMTVHGAVMVLAGLGFGYAVRRARKLPTWTAIALMTGVVLVALTQTMPEGVQLIATGVRDLGFVGMGLAMLRPPAGRYDGPGPPGHWRFSPPLARGDARGVSRRSGRESHARLDNELAGAYA